jgi:ssDNA-specific exonuclease RecJ
MTTMDDTDSQERLGDDRGRRLRRTLVAAGAGLGMMLAGLGIATAQTGGSDPPTTTTVPADGERRPGRHHGVRVSLAAAASAIGIGEDELRTALRSGQSIAQVAQSRNVDVQKVIDAIVADARQRIAEKVQSGDLTQAQADERLADLPQRVTDLVNRTGGLRHGPGRHGRHGRHGPGPGLAVAASAIGIGEDELRTALRSGQSIAQVAQSRNVDVQKVIDAIVADARQRIAEKVQSGDLTQAQADERLADLPQRVTDLVNRTGGPGHGHRPRPADGERPS